MRSIKKFLESLIDEDNFNKSAGTALKIVGSVFAANVLSNWLLDYDLDRTGLARHLYAGLVMGGVLIRATEGVPLIPRVMGIATIIAGANHGWEYFENHMHLYGTVPDSKFNSFSDLSSVYLGSALGVIKGYMDKKNQSAVL